MVTQIVLMLKYLYDEIWTLYLYSKVLGRKYSLKITIIIMLSWYLLPSILKITALYQLGLDDMMNQVLTWTGSLLYVLLVFRSTVGKKILALILMFVVQISSEIVCYIPAELLTGSFDFMQTDSIYTIVCILLILPVEAFGYLMLVKHWKYIEKTEWRGSYQLWLAIIFPVSQFMLCFHIGFFHNLSSLQIPFLCLLGIILSLLVDVYMFQLFLRSGRRERAERELRQLQQQYGLEKIRYEQLMKMQEETAKIRHDYQNYVLMMRNIK